MSKSPDAFRTISEVSEWLDTPTYVLRFWESRFPQIKPVKRAGGRRYYRPEDMMLLGGIKKLLHFDELTIKAAKALLKDKGVRHVMELSPDLNTPVVTPQSTADAADKADISRMVKETSQEEVKPKPAVEVRVVKKAKQAAAEEKPLAGPTADPVTQSAPSPEETPMSKDTPEEKTKAAQAGSESPDPQESAPAPVEDASEAASEKADEPVVDPAMQAKATEAERQAAAQQAALAKAAADEEAEDWAGLVPDMVMNAPYRIGTPDDYDSKTMGEIEMLYYSLRMARNKMRRSIKQHENRPS
ncbi:MAG: MerR family transcriptional regulator [Rhodobacteraceae bacterium]|nr:MerR family transcriptional regulator [Paracoccaceae bacterium]